MLTPEAYLQSIQRLHLKDAAVETVPDAAVVSRCRNCGEEIWYNPNMVNAGWTWESEDMLGWCEGSPKTRKHEPVTISK